MRYEVADLHREFTVLYQKNNVYTASSNENFITSVTDQITETLKKSLYLFCVFKDLFLNTILRGYFEMQKKKLRVVYFAFKPDKSGRGVCSSAL